MAYRPYPSVDRALRQLDRHYSPAPVIELPECLRPMAASFAQLRVDARRALEARAKAGTYVLSTRRGVVGADG
jgi:hypothetical protein